MSLPSPLIKTLEEGEEHSLYPGLFALLPKGAPFLAFVGGERRMHLGEPVYPREEAKVADRDFVVKLDKVGTSSGATYLTWDSGYARVAQKNTLLPLNMDAILDGVPFELFPCYRLDDKEDLECHFKNEIAREQRVRETREILAPVLAKILDRRIAGEKVSDDEEAKLVTQALEPFKP